MIHDHIVQDNQGRDLCLRDYQGKVPLIVSTASRCGFIKQYAGLQDLYEKYRDRGLEILAFPCNQFGHQELGSNQEIQNFYADMFSVTFPIMAKIDVNGEGEGPLYTDLKRSQGGLFESAVKWNSTKFLVDRKGKVVGRLAPATSPQDLEKDIEKIP